MANKKRPAVDKSVQIRGDASGNVVVTGNENEVTLAYERVKLPDPSGINVKAEIKAMHEILAKLQAPDRAKVENAFNDIHDELSKPEPDKHEVGKALERVFSYATKAEGFLDSISKLKTHIMRVVAWLGPNWHKILSILHLTT